MSTVTSPSTIESESGLFDRLSATFWRRPKLLLVLMLTPPLLWLGIIYIGSLFALLAQSFFSLDPSAGGIVIATFGAALAIVGLWLTDDRFVPGRRAAADS